MGEGPPDHLYLKWCLLTAAQEAGAVAEAEVPGPGWAMDALQQKGFRAEHVGRSMGDARYAGGVPLMGEAAHPVAVIDPDPGQAGSRVLAATVLVFTNGELRSRFLAQAPQPPWDVSNRYVTLTLDFNPPAPAAPVPALLNVSIPQQPTAGARRASPCSCDAPSLHVVFPDGVEVVFRRAVAGCWV
ncbi:hypothetical protein [Streptomyces sp. NPDC097981]|uniref:hypothetical protein n=1 Tax=Streptomyces sp. NPDC097981 TaxID=3155428 RepID=UPI00331789B4